MKEKFKCVGFNKNPIVHSKILHHFIKGKIFLSPMEMILAILNELESLESLVKLARKKCKEGLKTINLTKVEGSHVIQRININKNHCNKMLHSLGEDNNNPIEGLVDTSVFMLINLLTAIVRELGIIYLIFGSESDNTALDVVIQTLGKISELHVQVGDVQCLMNFMMVDIDKYDIFLGLDFFIKIGAFVDIEKGMIQIRWGLGNNI
jgi:hypothetical protein